jgi:SAM-dependent methyltransferase
MTSEGLAGRGLLQSPQEWDARNRVLSDSMAGLIGRFATASTGRGIEVGCQNGVLIDAMERQTAYSWVGVDPAIAQPGRSAEGLELLPGRASSVPFADARFDVALLANVYEHVQPEERAASFQELARILVPGGVVVGQLPNPYFPIESHSRLPFMGWLPVRLQKVYWRLSPVPWEHDFFVVTIRHLVRTARGAGFEPLFVANFNYPPEVIPRTVRPIARLLERPMRRLPWAWQFVLSKGPVQPARLDRRA